MVVVIVSHPTPVGNFRQVPADRHSQGHLVLVVKVVRPDLLVARAVDPTCIARLVGFLIVAGFHIG